ncbi:MAG: tetratricopeptide repeat protein [Acidobacteriota bacterium]|nr:tetratricopeptide repeat protein [Acidobacteriota bacterium]
MALRQHPNEGGLYNLLGIVDAQEKRYPAAERNFVKAIELRPQLTASYLNLGRLYTRAGNQDSAATAKAVEIYQQLLKLKPDLPEARYELAALLQQTGAFRESLAEVARLPMPEQERSQALAVRCADLAALGRYPEANEAALRFLRAPELSEQEALFLVEALRRHKLDELALQILESLAERRIASLDGLYALASAYERANQLARAREIFETVARQKSDPVQPLLDLARVAHKQRDYQAALGYLAHARELDPRNAAIHFFFGMVCIDLRLPIEAKASLGKALELDSENPYYNYALGSVLLQWRNTSEAVPYFKKYAELKHNDVRGRFALGAAYFYSGDYDSAKSELRAIVDAPETAVGAHYFLGRIAKQEDRLAEAAAHFADALRKNPYQPEVLAESALIHIRQENFETAAGELERAIEIDSDSFRANGNLLMLYQRTKDSRTAAQARRFDEIKRTRSEKEDMLQRTIQIQPY